MISAVVPVDHDADTALMLRVKRGDNDAFIQLVDRYKQPVFNLVCRTIGDETEAEDIAQNVFIQIYKFAPRYEPSAKFSTWLYTIARNLSLNEIRRRGRHPAESLDQPARETENPEPLPVSDPRVLAPGDQLLIGELQSKIEEALQALPENQRTAILLFREEDMSYDEISKVLGASLSATKSLIHRGRETLKQILKPYLKHGTWSDSNE
jgi:RNA polymerase sigma-70 factor (ECF subfamily)